MNMSAVYLTKEGYDALSKRLDYLMAHGRKEVAEKIKIAREFGDLSENAEYEAAKEEQGFIEKEIREISEKLRQAIIIDDENLDNAVVAVGSTVTIYDREFGEQLDYRIVGTSEADHTAGLISNESPLGKALIGKKKHDIIHVQTPSGCKLEFEIIKIGN
ncbi:MAG: transcription elongation factor GreA [Christensenellales bacterium]